MTDRSASMAGFDKSLGGPLHGALTALQHSAAKEGVSAFHAINFSAKADDAEKSIAGLTQVLSEKSSAAGTCLTAPLDRLLSQPASAQEQVWVIFTDGVPSASKACGCADAIDVNCIAGRLKAVVDRGFGIWVVGLRVPFEGTYYSEMPPQPKISLPAGSVRPLYFWIVTRNIHLGRSAANAVLSQANAEAPLGFEVWPGQWEGPVNAPASSVSAFVASSTTPCGDRSKQAQIVAFGDEAGLHGPKSSLGLKWAGPKAFWKGKVPVSQLAADLGGLKPLIRSSGDEIRPIDGVRNASLVNSECLEIFAESATFGNRWTLSSDGAFLQAWSTTSDTTRPNLDKTLLLKELWVTAADLIMQPTVIQRVAAVVHRH